MATSRLASAMAVGAPRFCCSRPAHRKFSPTNKKPMSAVKFITISRNFPSNSGAEWSFQIRASDRRSENPGPGVGKDDGALDIQRDLNYLWKLGAGSIAGAGAIKYGSIIVPEITRPNITLALLMIFTPVLVALVLLIRESYMKPQS